MWSSILIGFFGVVASVAVAGGIFLFVFNRYSEIEGGVFQFIGNYANEIYDLLDKMFRRRSLQQCYLIILVPTGIMGFLGFIVGVKLGASMGGLMAILVPFIASFVVGALGFKAPGMIIRFQFQRRLEKFDKQLVDALNMMSNAIKSGLSFMQVISVLEREMPTPCAEEFGMVLKENRVGVNLNDALMNMTKRVPSEDLFMIMNSVVTLSQQGGDLSEAFDTIATTIRERQRVSEKIKTLAQAGVTQGFILSCLPLVMLMLLYFTQPEYTMLLFTTPLGLAMLGAMMTMIIGGGLWMKSILTIEI